MLSILIASRKKGNGDSKLMLLLDSLEKDSINKNFEVLIKFDSDDYLPISKELNKFSFPIKYLVDSRGNGRLDLHLSYTKLLSIADKNTTMFTTFADDFIVTPQWDLIVDNTIKKIIGDIFIIQFIPHPPRNREDYWSNQFNMSYDLNKMEDIISLEIAPIFSKSLIYLTGGLGYVSFTDVWSYYLQRLLFDLYGIKITFFTDKEYVTRTNPQGAWRTQQEVQEKINEDIRNFGFIKSDFFKAITRTQVENIMRYLTYSKYGKN